MHVYVQRLWNLLYLLRVTEGELAFILVQPQVPSASDGVGSECSTDSHIHVHSHPDGNGIARKARGSL